MKTFIALAILLATAVTASAQQRAPRSANPPSDLWCREMRITESSSVPYCMAYTLEQCLASRASPNERCYLNPIYDPRFRR
ncbi:MAG: hypothetical protein KF826_12675 [Xanthobacteraceae bacterium]|nr:hypothetical protein [Xanthobacteraceae bacterium]MBX3550283.1 hypothetical protein [Xanthobacteraceae bacterium]MCW5678009.1 hypothetical protein [Xanthobacteraceae bacterium]